MGICDGAEWYKVHYVLKGKTMTKMIASLSLVFLMLIVTCSSEDASTPVVQVADPTSTSYPTYTPDPTSTTTPLPEPTPIVAPTSTPELTATPTSVPTSSMFDSGIYYRLPSVETSEALLNRVGSSLSFNPHITEFDINSTMIVWAVGNELMMARPNGAIDTVVVRGLHQIDRPALSPDGNKVAVQARETYTEPEDININASIMLVLHRA